MFKLGQLHGSEEVPLVRAAVFEREATSGPERLRIGVPPSGTNPLLILAACLEPPFTVLYLLHTPRGVPAHGRYESPPLTREALLAFFSAYLPFFSTDARHDVWVHSFTPEATLVWDRHDILFAYGPLEQFQNVLLREGFTPGVPSIPSPHSHHYHAAFDAQQTAVLGAFAWRHSPLRPQDEQ